MDIALLQELDVSNFRNLEKVLLRPHLRFNIISGKNGSGKTNLLEAIYLFGTLRSFRTSSRSELIRWGAAAAVAKGYFSIDSGCFESEISISSDSRRTSIDGKPVSSADWRFQNLPMVLFHPSTMGIVQEGPEQRRRFLNRALFQADKMYARLYRDYLKALASRNILLKKTTGEKSPISYFDPQLAELSASIVEKRKQFVEKFKPCFAEAFESVSNGMTAGISYAPKMDGDRTDILRELERKLDADKKRGFTSIGPHADDLGIEMEGRPARKFASQGQQRMIALAMKIAEVNVLSGINERIPILLLDDVSSELDREKNKKLFEFLDSAGGQVFITTTHLDHILIEKERADFSVENGKISPMVRS